MKIFCYFKATPIWLIKVLNEFLMINCDVSDRSSRVWYIFYIFVSPKSIDQNQVVEVYSTKLADLGICKGFISIFFHYKLY